MLDQHVHGLHEAVGAAAVDGPDDVAESPAQVVVDVLGGVFAQGVEVERVSPTGRAPGSDEADQQGLDDAPMVEQALVGSVVHGVSAGGASP